MRVLRPLRVLVVLTALVSAASGVPMTALRTGTRSNVVAAPAANTAEANAWRVSPGAGAGVAYAPAPVVLDAPPPARLDIDVIDVHTSLTDLDVQHDGTIAVPTSYDVAGWFVRGPRPGENGPALVAGHVDSHSGPAVFFRLRELRPGDQIVVTRVDGSRVTFAVEAVMQFPKQRFPSDLVFGSTSRKELRLVTCGGEFDHARDSYRDNIVVFAALTGP
jgi:hypothetical protein